MKLKEAIETRRSIRHFNEQNVSREEISKILQSGILSPSAHNRQPWNFYIIDKDKKKKMR